MIKNLYHRISNKILLYKYDKHLWKLPFYHLFSIIDLILYVMSPIAFHKSRHAACGDTYIVSDLGIFVSGFDGLQDYIHRTQSGIAKRCPMVLWKFKEDYEQPLIASVLTLDKREHFNRRKAVVDLDILPRDSIPQEVSELIEKCILNGNLTMNSRTTAFKKFIYKQLRVNVDDQILDDLNKPLPMFFTLLLSVYLPEKLLVTDKKRKSIENLAKLLIEQYPNMSYEDALTTIGSTESGINVIIFVLFQTIKQIIKHNLINIIREELETGSDNLLYRCFFDASRFAKYHGGGTAVETLETPQQITIDNKTLTLQAGESLIRSIPYNLQDPKYFSTDFYPYQPNIDLIRATTFNGIYATNGKIDTNFHNRSCSGQVILPIIIVEIIKQLILNYTWDSDNANGLETPFQSITLKNIRKKH